MATDLPVIFHHEAFAELEQSKSWYNEQAEGLGDAFFQEIQLAISRHSNKHHAPGHPIHTVLVGFSCIDSLLQSCTTSLLKISTSWLSCISKEGLATGRNVHETTMSYEKLVFRTSMQPTQTSESHRTPEVEPGIRHVVPWRVISVSAKANLCLQATFVDGTKGEVDLRNFLNSPQVAGTVFEPLGDEKAFSKAGIVMGAVQWANGADLAPDAMYDAIKSQGRWIVE